MLKIRRPLGRLIFNMGIAIPGKTVFLIETAPRWYVTTVTFDTSKSVQRYYQWSFIALQWRHNDRDGVSNHLRFDCLFSRLLRRRSKKISKLRVTGLCAGNSVVTDEFPAQKVSNADNASIGWRHHWSWFTDVTIWSRIMAIVDSPCRLGCKLSPFVRG